MADTTYKEQIKNAQTDFIQSTDDVNAILETIKRTDPYYESQYHLVLQTSTKVFEPPVEGEVTIEWERTNTPGKLEFTTIKVEGQDMSFHEGDRVLFFNRFWTGSAHYFGLMFVGYVFKKNRDKKHHINVTCYDQLRYLKNKYTWVFEKKTASQILSSICSDYGLQQGGIAGTGYVIPIMAKENCEAFDVILEALEETLANTGQMYVLHDSNGLIRLENVANMKRAILIDEETAQNFEYTSSIDDETYNSIVLYYNPNG